MGVLLFFGLFSSLAVGERPAREWVEGFPLSGYYRAGRFMPVWLVSSKADVGEFRFTADATVPLLIRSSGESINAVAPWLALAPAVASAHDAMDGQNSPIDHRFQLLTENQQLIALTNINPVLVSSIFPGKQVVTVELDPANPLPGDIAAWESLDGIVLDENAAGRITDRQLRGLLAAGTTVAIGSQRRPAGNWPWQHAGDFWLLRNTRIAPDTLISPDAYAPTYGWIRGVPTSRRKTVLFAAAIIAIIAIALSLRPGWRMTVATTLLAIIASLAVVFSPLSSAPLNTLDAEIVINHDGLTQHDHWHWVASPTLHAIAFPAVGLTHPILFSSHSMEQIGLTTQYNAASGKMTINAVLPPDVAMALVSTTIAPGEAPPSNLAPATSVFATMAQSVYSASGVTPIGQVERPDGMMVIYCQAEERK